MDLCRHNYKYIGRSEFVCTICDKTITDSEYCEYRSTVAIHNLASQLSVDLLYIDGECPHCDNTSHDVLSHVDCWKTWAFEKRHY